MSISYSGVTAQIGEEYSLVVVTSQYHTLEVRVQSRITTSVLDLS